MKKFLGLFVMLLMCSVTLVSFAANEPQTTEKSELIISVIDNTVSNVVSEVPEVAIFSNSFEASTGAENLIVSDTEELENKGYEDTFKADLYGTRSETVKLEPIVQCELYTPNEG